MNSALQGWYVDPSTGTNLRFWNGNTWTDEVAPLQNEPILHDSPVPATTQDGLLEGGLDPDLELTFLTRRELRARRGGEAIPDDAPRHLPPVAAEPVESWLEPIEITPAEAIEIPAWVTPPVEVEDDPARKHRIVRMSVLLGVLAVVSTVAVLTAGSL